MNTSTPSLRRDSPTTQLGLFGGTLAAQGGERSEGGALGQLSAPRPSLPTLEPSKPAHITAPPKPHTAASPVLRVLEAAGCLSGSGPDFEARLELSPFAVQDLAAEWEGAESTAGLATAARRVAAMLAATWPR